MAATVLSLLGPLGPATATMALPGTFEVDQAGAATYRVPIAVPPGTAGMAPNLTLDYNSQHGNGVLGVGWSLGGLPTVSRCARTIAQDGVDGGVTYDAQDRFCLDGQRLVAVSGTYGANGTEYRTEREGFSKIVSFGTGPAWFKVWTKAGLILEFGNTADARVEAQGKPTARAWAVNRIQDTKGNYIAVTYQEDGQNGVAVPTRIDYTGNAGASLAPYASVRFVYGTRPDAVAPAYQAGSRSLTTALLTNVQTFVGTTLVHDYRLGYALGNALGHSRLTSLTLCDGGTACLPPTTFDWQTQAFSLPGTLRQETLPANFTYIAGDWNGDGRTDLFMQAKASTDQSSMLLADENGGWSVASSLPGLHTRRMFTGDWNGDGKTDAGACDSTNCTYYLSTGTSLTPAGSAAWGVYVHAIGDWDGDGRSDLLLINPTHQDALSYFMLSNGDGSFRNFGPGETAWGGPGRRVFVGDWNGDGKTDLMECARIYSPNLNLCAFYHMTETGHTLPAGLHETFPWADYGFAVGDWNGDGKSDLLLIAPDPAANSIMKVSNGNGTFTTFQDTGFVATGWGQDSLATGDWNGDGKTDIARISNTAGGASEFLLSTGVGFESAGFTPTTWGDHELVVGDWNGDGASDVLVRPSDGAGTQYVTGFAPERLTGITTGLGAQITIAYERLTKSAVYTKDNNARYPTIDFQGTAYVVSRVERSDGIGGATATTYSYAGAKADIHGRGFLGFRQITTADARTGIQTTTTYRQEYPFVGLIARTVKRSTANAVDLNRTENVFAATVQGPGRHLVQLTRSIEYSNDLDGTTLPWVETRYAYDTWGNATQVSVRTADGFSKTTTNTYTNDATNWILGRLTRASVTSQSDLGPQPEPPNAVDVTVGQSVVNFVLADAAFMAGWQPGMGVKATVKSGVVVSSNSTAQAAFDTGTFPAATPLELIVSSGASILGRGGNGGAGGSSQDTVFVIVTSPAVAGGTGGPALRAQHPITITNNGLIGGGGGGGGGGATAWVRESSGDEHWSYTVGGGGGGGGAGIVSGSGGAGGQGDSAVGNNGGAGGTTSGGGGGSGKSVTTSQSGGVVSGNGGAGGGLGLPGSNGGNGNRGGTGASGAAAGAAAIGGTNITWVVVGDRRGPVQ